MQAEVFAEYDATRHLSKQTFHSCCYAPYTSLYFDTAGNVRACCHNYTHRLGNVKERTLDEIWQGQPLRTLQTAVYKDDLSYGCDYCEWQLTTRAFHRLPARKWDSLIAESAEPRWPKMMEFSISNTCNLECIMCDGNHSSAIRANREHCDPLENAYDEGFFQQLRAYLPHLERCKFLGGEPFLQENCYRIWSLIREEHASLPCHATTNGTVWNARVEKTLNAVAFGIAVSIDGYTKKTIEAVRVHARYEYLIANILRLRDYTRSRGTSFSLTFCLMRQNWHEFGRLCLFADHLDCDVGVNLVRRPAQMSLYALPTDEIGVILRAMEEETIVLEPQLGRNRGVWLGELSRLRAHMTSSRIVPDLVHIAGVDPTVSA
ncbi:radical SAM protein [Terracidiphilus sp.]|jgi:radical SAM protein with 4Fe4S-binding SPASM domain|uniref:radical SAM protein n=1 Tax=Terracidiphilus sp. TaxID=1964191 RepID=UPI003C16307A